MSHASQATFPFADTRDQAQMDWKQARMWHVGGKVVETDGSEQKVSIRVGWPKPEISRLQPVTVGFRKLARVVVRHVQR